MNSYDTSFFKKYLPDETEILGVIHRHIVLIIDRIFLFLIWGAVLPSFIYYQSLRIQELIPFHFFEIYLLLLFIKIVYDIFNWYNDVWVITKDTLYDIRWSLLKSSAESVNYENIEWIEVEQNGLWDKAIWKGNLVVHMHWQDSLRINDIADPFTTSNMLSEYTHKEEVEPEKDRFELILETLNGVVNEYLDRRWLRQTEKAASLDTQEYIKEIEEVEGTIDLRNKN